MKNREESVSAVMWVPLLWLLRCGSRSLAYWLDPEMAVVVEQDYLYGNPFDRYFFVVLEIIGVSVLLWRRFTLLTFIKNNKLIVLLYLFMAVSMLWSQFPEVALRRWVRTMGDLIMVLVILTEVDVEASVQWMLRRFAYLLVPLSVILVKYYRHLGVAYDYSGRFEMWIGVTTHKNSLAQVAAVAALFFIWAFLRKKATLFDIPVMVMALWLLAGSRTSNSVTSILAFLLGSVLMVAFIRMKNVKALATFIALVLPLLFLTEVVLEVFLRSSIFFEVLESSGRDESLTGRTDLWVEVIRIGMNHPFVGAGYGTFWMGDLTHNLWDIFPWRPGQAHNGYIDLFVETGFVGLLLIIAIVVRGIKSSWLMIANGDEYGKLRLIWIVLIIMYNISESSFTKPTTILWFLFLLFAIHDPQEQQGQRAGEELAFETDVGEKSEEG